MQADENAALTSSNTVETIAAPPRPATAISWTGRLEPRLAWLLAWGTKGSLALTDQALFAGAQFALNILLARWLDPAGYGAFAVAYSVYLLASAVHSALLVEPMMVFGSGRYLEKRRSYLGIVLRGHWLLTASMGLILFGVGLLVGRLNSRPVGHALCALGVALPLMLLLWLTRRAFFIEMRPGRAAAGSAVYFCTLVASVWWLRGEQMLTSAAAILAMGVSSLLAAVLQLTWLGSQWSHALAKLSARKVASEHWGYGRWVLAAVFPSWTLLGLYYLVLPIWFGLGASGALKAIMNLAMPASHSLVAAGALILPLMVRHRDRGGFRLMRQTVWRVTALFVGGAGFYFLILWLFRVRIISLLYGGKYLEYSGLPVLLVGLVPLVTAGSVTFGAALSACERPDRVFWANVVASAFAVSLGLWMTADWGVLGAVAGYLASYMILVGVFWVIYRRLRPSGEPGGSAV
jgi:O-antigen/teichoic acid export membrane protein